MTRHTAAVLAAVLLAGGCGSSEPRRAVSPSASTPVPSAPLATSASPVPTDVPEFVIGVLGDWGQRGEAVHQVAGLVAGLDGDNPLDAIVTTGDNAYNRGRPAEAAFAKGIMDGMAGPGTRVLATLGNHDFATERGEHVMRALGMPAPWYSAVVGSVELVLLDSNQPSRDEQVAFLDRTLAAPRRTPFRVVAFHHPPMSCSLHEPHEEVGRVWLPRFRGKVDLVLAGHNHDYERFVGPGGTPYVTTGGGGAQLYSALRFKCTGPGRATVLRTVHHALRLTATATSLRVEAVGLDGKSFDDFTLAPRR